MHAWPQTPGLDIPSFHTVGSTELQHLPTIITYCHGSLQKMLLYRKNSISEDFYKNRAVSVFQGWGIRGRILTVCFIFLRANPLFYCGGRNFPLKTHSICSVSNFVLASDHITGLVKMVRL